MNSINVIIEIFDTPILVRPKKGAELTSHIKIVLDLLSKSVEVDFKGYQLLLNLALENAQLRRWLLSVARSG